MSERYQDNGDGTITDKETSLQWFREDSWQIETRWFTWDEAFNFAVNQGQIRFAGFNDWRLPTLEEAMSLVAPEANNKDKYEKDIFLDPMFPAGCLATFWSLDGLGSDGYTVNLNTGTYSLLYKSKSGRMGSRLVRGTPVGLEDILEKQTS